MAAPTISALLDYETNIEDALKTYLTNVMATTQILTPRVLYSSQPILTTPRVAVSVTITGTNPNQTGTRTTDSKDYDSHKLGMVSLVATTRRDASGQSLGSLRGNCRAAMESATAALNSNTLPYYQILTLREAGSGIGADPENDEISAMLTWNLAFYIKPDQWASNVYS
jgi:hypothetical protein